MIRPGPRWGSLQRSPDPLAGFKGPTSKGRGGEGSDCDGGIGGKGWKGKGRGGEKGRGGKGREEEGREGEGGRIDPNFSLPPAAPAYNNKP